MAYVYDDYTYNNHCKDSHVRVINTLLFSPDLRHGVFRAATLESLLKLKQQCEENDFQYIEIDGLSISSKVEIIDTLENVLKPPTIFGANWDELEFQLKGLDWIDSKGVTLVYKDFQVFQQMNPKDFTIFVDIIYSVMSHPELCHRNSKSGG